MKRFAFMLGNTDGLAGVKKDLHRFKSFLESDIGGAWERDDEIFCHCDLTYDEVMPIIETIRNESYDYVVFYFSGHGGMKRSTELCLNANGDILSECELSGLANKQLSIYDCCRVFPKMVKTATNFALDESVESYLSRRRLYRKRFDALIADASEQDVRLYACHPDRYANDTSDGGVYTKHLLDVAEIQSLTGDVFVKKAHTLATNAVVIDPDAFSNGVIQYPDITINTKDCPPKDLVLALGRSAYI